jgi:hypothetical protein
VVKATGSSNKRISLAALIAVNQPGLSSVSWGFLPG